MLESLSHRNTGSETVLTVSEENAMESVPNVKLFRLYFIRYIIYLI